MPTGAEEGIVRGMYLVRPSRIATPPCRARVQLLGSGTILCEALSAAELLERDWNIGADVWSMTSFTELRRDGLEAERRNRVNAPRRFSWVEQCLGPLQGPAIAASDYVRAVPDLIRTWMPRRYVTLGTDGFGRSDTRAALRNFFEVDSMAMAFTSVVALAEEQTVPQSPVHEFMERYNYAPTACAPWADHRDTAQRDAREFKAARAADVRQSTPV